MNRRKFLSGIIPTSIVAGSAFASTPRVLPDRVSIGQWEVRWLGYKNAYASDVLIGVWTAVRQLDEVRAYATTGGRAYRYYPGDVFDQRYDDSHPLMSEETTEQVRESRRRLACEELVRFIADERNLEWR